MPEKDLTQKYMSQDQERMNQAARSFLNEWLSSMNDALDSWRQEFLPNDFPFNFTLDSLDELESLLLQRYTVDDSVDSDSMTEGAVRYIGETLRRNVASRWGYQDLGDESDDPSNRTPLIRSNTSLEFIQDVAPVRRIKFLIRKRRPGTLRKSIILLLNAIDEEEKSGR
ncbi:hypothetical protein [Streptomyces sp. 35G-GA-8]|uniref:hypothetical protein n=1 Tax=Streptomyces sp. 35G-GA-8 TaxID=2939434 RepID=UPI00201E7E4A|nr:hypothetical protein [Streptomyces sp. 35G-GA-8]MCL7375249.1 hypothetical protein [Streptomyces sp. 35G-GA-8]